MVVHAQNPRTQGAEAGDFHKFKASLQDRETLSRSKQQQQQNIKPRPDASDSALACVRASCGRGLLILPVPPGQERRTVWSFW